jgi:hypothetical protein
MLTMMNLMMNQFEQLGELVTIGLMHLSKLSVQQRVK